MSSRKFVKFVRYSLTSLQEIFNPSQREQSNGAVRVDVQFPIESESWTNEQLTPRLIKGMSQKCLDLSQWNTLTDDTIVGFDIGRCVNISIFCSHWESGRMTDIGEKIMAIYIVSWFLNRNFLHPEDKIRVVWWHDKIVLSWFISANYQWKSAWNFIYWWHILAIKTILNVQSKPAKPDCNIALKCDWRSSEEISLPGQFSQNHSGLFRTHPSGYSNSFRNQELNKMKWLNVKRLIVISFKVDLFTL
jgi:hypothetical protein